MIEKIKKFFFWDYSDIEENILFKNEVQANRTAAITMGNECIVLLIAIFYGIITQYQRITLIAIESFVEMIIPATICFIFKGRKTWIKYTLLIGQLLVLIRLNTSLAIYTFPLLLVPIILAFLLEILNIFSIVT